MGIFILFAVLHIVCGIISISMWEEDFPLSGVDNATKITLLIGGGCALIGTLIGRACHAEDRR